MKLTEKKKLFLKTLLILLICLADIVWAAGALYTWKSAGTALSVKTASADILGILMQNLIVSAIPLLLFIICLAILKKQFFCQMYFKVSNKSK